ncbi:MAG: EVE domain-containing protein [Nitrososphaerales archaeon]
MLNYWIFVVIDHKMNNRVIKAMHVLEDRVQGGFWSLNRRTGNFNRIKEGDRVIFYIGGREGKRFVGRCTLASEPHPMDSEQRKRVMGYPSALFTHAVNLENIKLWMEPLPVSDLAEELVFIKKKDLWKVYFRRSIIPIPEKDYNEIISRAEG